MAKRNPDRPTPGLTADVHDPLIGRLIDNRYRLRQSIGEGGMGCVYLAVHERMPDRRDVNRLFAVKLLSVLSHSMINERFVREIKAVSGISSPNIVGIVDSGFTADNIPYLVMPYLRGMDLEHALEEENPFSFEKSKSISLQVCSALKAAHEHREKGVLKPIVHRDIKPSNIFISQEDSAEIVKLLDFGIAKIHDPRGFSEEERAKLTVGGRIGTPRYMSPEQAADREDVDHRADLYSLGIVMYEMLTGETPFAGSVDVYSMHIDARPPSLREKNPDIEIPPGIEPIVMRALEKKREMRFQSAREMHDAIRDCTWPKTIQVPKRFGELDLGKERPTHLHKPPSSGIGGAVLALAILGLAAGGGYYYYSRHIAKQETSKQETQKKPAPLMRDSGVKPDSFLKPDSRLLRRHQRHRQRRPRRRRH